VVIVGGGPAGLSTALFLAHLRPALRGRMLVIEKEYYPREKFCAGAIGGRAELALARIGAMPDVPSVPAAGISVAMPQGTMVARERHIGRVVRRIEYDAELAAVARRRGIEIAEGVRLEGLEVHGDGVRLATSRGELRARVVVGADGVGSAVRRALGLGGGVWRAQVLEVDVPQTDRDLPRDLLHFDVSDHEFDGYEWDFPTLVGGEALVCSGVYRLIVPGKRASSDDLAARLATRLARRGLDLGACKKKRYAERGFAPHEPCARPRVLLVGEAAGIDPITGEGIAQAILYGEAAAPYLLRKLDRNDLVFSDWPRALGSTLLGVDMRTRHFICSRFFGPARGFYESGFQATPEGLQAGIQYFGGLRVDRRLAARVGASVARHLWKHRELRPLRGIPT
jgi:menaquinone-9 beta-reductase